MQPVVESLNTELSIAHHLKESNKIFLSDFYSIEFFRFFSNLSGFIANSVNKKGFLFIYLNI